MARTCLLRPASLLDATSPAGIGVQTAADFRITTIYRVRFGIVAYTMEHSEQWWFVIGLRIQHENVPTNHRHCHKQYSSNLRHSYL